MVPWGRGQLRPDPVHHQGPCRWEALFLPATLTTMPPLTPSEKTQHHWACFSSSTLLHSEPRNPQVPSGLQATGDGVASSAFFPHMPSLQKSQGKKRQPLVPMLRYTHKPQRTHGGISQKHPTVLHSGKRAPLSWA